jgi:hypothetical protein
MDNGWSLRWERRVVAIGREQELATATEAGCSCLKVGKESTCRWDIS